MASGGTLLPAGGGGGEERGGWVRGCTWYLSVPRNLPFYSSDFGVPIAITFTRFFYVLIAVQQRGRAALYVFAYLCSFLCTASLPCCFFIMHGLIATAAAEKKAQTTAPARGGGRDISAGARGVLQTELMGLITALRQRNRPKWTSRAVSRGGFFATTQTQTTGFLVRG